MPTKRPHAAAEFHHAYLAALRSQTEPAEVLAGVLTKKLREQGIDGSKHFEAIKRAAVQLLAAPSTAEQSSFDLALDDEITGGCNVNIHLDGTDVEQAIEGITRAIETASQDIYGSRCAHSSASTERFASCLWNWPMTAAPLSLSTTPELAAEYLTAVGKTEHNEDIVRSILKMRGTLAPAAPAELANLTAQALIARPRRRECDLGREREEAFTYLDHEFIQASPAQGPFFDLLTNSPKDGLALVHRLVAHAVAHGSRGADPATNGFDLALPGGARTFPWTQTYFWSRNSNFYAVTSALMALEAWAHRRIEAGESFEGVLTDVLGPQGSCAAYLLVAVDLIISHWPKSLGVAATLHPCG